MLLLFLDDLVSLALEAESFLEQLAVGDQAFTRVNLLLEGVGAVGKGLFAHGQALFLLLVALDQEALFTSYPFVLTDEVSFDFVF